MHGIKLIVFGIVILLGAFILSAPVYAGLHHDHHSVDSQLNKASQGKHHHCALKGHSISNPCPHILNPKSQPQKLAIGPECGGLPFPSKSIPLPSIQKVFSNHENDFLVVPVNMEKNAFSPDLYVYSSLSAIDHPPKP